MAARFNEAATYWNQSFHVTLCTTGGTIGSECLVLNPVDPVLPPGQAPSQ